MKFIVSTLRKIKLWGIKGVVDAVRTRAESVRLRRYFNMTVKSYKGRQEPGFTVIANFSVKSSLCKTMRDLVIALHNAKIPYQTYNLGKDNELSCDYELFTPRSKFAILRYTHSIEMLHSVIPDSFPIQKNIICFWEFDSGLRESYPFMLEAKNIVAMSDFNYKYFQAELGGCCHVQKLLYPFRLHVESNEPAERTRSRYGFSADDFIVFYNVGIGSARKNPDGCIKAFAQAFPKTPSAKLLMKITHAQTRPREFAELKALACSLGIANQVSMLTEYLSDEEIVNITNAVDVYFSPHRGEGFGLGMAEAMALGKCVVATDWSASTEFVSTCHAMPIPYTLKPIEPSEFDKAVYVNVTRWAEPDLTAAANTLKRLFADRSLCRQVGERGSKFMHEYFSTKKFAESAKSILGENL